MTEVISSANGTGVVQVRSEPLTYREQGSFFQDLIRAQLFKDERALDRLQRHRRQVAESAQRVKPNTTVGQMGEFAPLAWPCPLREGVRRSPADSAVTAQGEVSA